ncbi:Putative stomatin/prohibitin-family membrane protease subunit protein [Minicystis rosea]|nr:Putative stomatin/prohibitin-family membrane protease subunit protein [Minicystis rosea]
MPRTIILHDHERGLLIRSGRVVAWLEPGRHRLWSRHTEVRKIDLDAAAIPLTPELRAVVPPGAAEEIEVLHRQIALVTVDGRPATCLLPGRWLLWQLRAEVDAEIVSTAPVLANDHVPAAFRALVPGTQLITATVGAHERALIYVDGALDRVVGEGAWAFFTADRSVSITRVDLREREIQIVGQEVMTADKVTVRLNLVVKMRITDAEKSVREVASIDAALYTEAQMVARRWVAGATVDQLLERRGDARAAMRAELRERAAGWGADVVEMDLKDIVLPGEMKTILNQVIEAEKRAAANVILRREETAATRSLMNTAKLLEQSPTLLRLKELEAWKDIAEKVDHLTLVATPQELASRLTIPGSGR